MVENKSSIFGIMALIIGASGLGLGVFSVVNIYMTEGSQGPSGMDGLDGTDGVDGEDAPGGLVVGILDPDYDETVSGNVTIRALIYGSENYDVSVVRNGTEIRTSIPTVWNTLTVSDGWWNITIIVQDTVTNVTSRDQVITLVYNGPSQWQSFDFLENVYLNTQFTPYYFNGVEVAFEYPTTTEFTLIFSAVCYSGDAAIVGQYLNYYFWLDGTQIAGANSNNRVYFSQIFDLVTLNIEKSVTLDPGMHRMNITVYHETTALVEYRFRNIILRVELS